MAKETRSGMDGMKSASPGSTAELRRQAEEIARQKAARSPENIAAMSPEETRQTLYELSVHQIELEMQNEELRRSQAELDAAQMRYFDLYDLAPVGYCTLSKEGVILESNLTASSLLGVARAALARRPLSRFILKEDQTIYFLHRKQLLDTGKPQTCDLRMVKKNGESFWASLEATTAQDANGEPMHRIVINNITLRKVAEEALQRAHDEMEQRVAVRTEELRQAIAELRGSEERYRTLFSRASDGILILSETGQIVEVNESFARMHGYSVQEMLHINLDDLATPESFHMFADRLRPLPAGETLIFEVDHYHKDGHILTLEVSARLISSGAEFYLQCFHRDITKRKQVQEALRQSEANFRRSLDESPLGIRILTIDHETIYANRAILDIYGFESLEELELTPVKKRYTRESYAEYLVRRQKRRQGMDAPSEYTISIIRKNSEVRHLQVFRRGILWDGERRYQIIYNDITRRKQAEEALVGQAEELKHTNTALNVLLRRQEEELRQTEQKIVANLQKFVLPYVEELRMLRLSPTQSSHVDIIHSNLQQVISPFLQNLTARYTTFTPREIQVSNLIMEGKTSKEIADIIKAAPCSVDFHRNNIRKKLGLTGEKTCLRTFLVTLSKK